MSREAPRLDSLAFRVALFFAMNPEEELSTGDLMAKFAQSDLHATWKTLQRTVQLGWLDRRRGTVNRRGPPQNVYSAGPELLKAIGR